MAVADQIQVASLFNRKSTGKEVLADIDLSGKVAIVTGGYSGIGLETTRALAEKGAKVIVAGRSMQRAKENLAELNQSIEMASMDLSDLTSVQSFANTILTKLDHVDLLINNAGIMACPETRVGSNWESQFLSLIHISEPTRPY